MPPKLIQFCTAMDNPEFNAMDFYAPGLIPKITWIMGTFLMLSPLIPPNSMPSITYYDAA